MIHGIGIDLIEIDRIKKLLRNKRQVSKENFNTRRNNNFIHLKVKRENLNFYLVVSQPKKLSVKH